MISRGSPIHQEEGFKVEVEVEVEVEVKVKVEVEVEKRQRTLHPLIN